MAAQGWLGLHVPEEQGGQGFTLAELAVVLEELGHALFPGPVLPTVLVSAALARGSRGPGGRAARVAARAGRRHGHGRRGAGRGASGPGGGARTGRCSVPATVRPVLGLPTARLVLVPLDDGTAAKRSWLLLDREASGDAVSVEALPALDATRPLGQLTIVGEGGVTVPPGQQVMLSDDDVRGLALTLAAAESAGIARWCLHTASEYAKVRVQFGRPIGQFQAVKHALADMLVAVEQAAAVAWDAAAAWSEDAGDDAASDADPSQDRHLSARIAGAVALGRGGALRQGVHPDPRRHRLHLGARRALLSEAGHGQPAAGGRRRHRRARARGGRAGHRGVAAQPGGRPASRGGVAARRRSAPSWRRWRRPTDADRRAAIAEAGLIMPHWPAPWGRGASPLEQLVIDEELAAAGVPRPHLAVGAWALPTLIAHGTPEQQERWVRPTLHGQLNWCQLFSEPGAGSDLAALSTRAERVEGGWVLNGQKVWTSLAQMADFGICLARSDPDAPKHAGITYFIVDMHAEGIDIRPLRELTGAAMFNEVFFNDVFVPDDAVVGAPGDGWRIGRTTLANERVSMSSGASFGPGVESLTRTMARRSERGEPSARQHGRATRAPHRRGAVHCAARSPRRRCARSRGWTRAAAASVRKLLGVEHEQRVQEMGMALYGADGAVLDGAAQRWEEGFLSTRCLTIAGGTSEVQRNVIAERILGQPRDPEPGA